MIDTAKIRAAAEAATSVSGYHQCMKSSDVFALLDEIESLKAERDAAFKMSKCECNSDEACSNLAQLHSELASKTDMLDEQVAFAIDVANQRDAALKELDSCKASAREWESVAVQGKADAAMKETK